MATFICQQCKQPLQLDPSLSDVPYDSISAALPSHKHRRSSSTSSSSTLDQQLSRLDIPEDAKSAIRNRPPIGAESFVLLKDNDTFPRRPSSSNRAATSISTPKKSISSTLAGDNSTTPSPRSKRPSIITSPSSPNAKTAINSPSSSRTPATPIPETIPPTPSTASSSKKTFAEAPLSPRAPPHRASAIRLFTMLQSRTELDHPLCTECTNLMIESLQRQLDETKKERDGYLAFEREMRKQKDKDKEVPGGAAEKQALQRMEQLKAQEIEAIQQLRSAEEEEKQLGFELAQLEREEKAMEEEEAEFWTAYSTTSMTITKLQDTLTSLEHSHAANALELAKLSRTNVYNDAFCIGHDGVFGTINGLRLGRVPNVPVEWSEINAAWGMTVLLLNTIARKVGFVFETWRLVPMGSFSKIERIAGNKDAYELYGSGDFNPLRWVHNRRFDTAMVAFLECLRQLMDYSRTQDPQVEFPQQVHKDKIGEASIKLPFAGDETWTRALRHVLLALKLLLKWATNG